MEVDVVRCFEPPGTVYALSELAIPSGDVPNVGQLTGAIFAYLQEVETRWKELTLTTQLQVGDPATKILTLSEDRDLVVMASHGRGGFGRWLLGSVTTKVARGITVPLLVIGEKSLNPDQSEPRIQTILVPMDGSEAAERALDQAAIWARAFSARVCLYQARSQSTTIDPEVIQWNLKELRQARAYLEEQAQRFPDLETETLAKDVTTSLEISDHARELGADLIVMGSHGKSGLSRWILGSVTEQVLQTSPCPILITH